MLIVNSQNTILGDAKPQAEPLLKLSESARTSAWRSWEVDGMLLLFQAIESLLHLYKYIVFYRMISIERLFFDV